MAFFLERQVMTNTVARMQGGAHNTQQPKKGIFMKLKCGSSSYFWEHENSRSCLGTDSISSAITMGSPLQNTMLTQNL